MGLFDGFPFYYSVTKYKVIPSCSLYFRLTPVKGVRQAASVNFKTYHVL